MKRFERRLACHHPGHYPHGGSYLSKDAGLDIEESFFRTDQRSGADEVLLAGTATELLPAVRIDGKSIGGSTVGQTTRRLYDLSRKQALAVSAA